MKTKTNKKERKKRNLTTKYALTKKMYLSNKTT